MLRARSALFEDCRHTPKAHLWIESVGDEKGRLFVHTRTVQGDQYGAYRNLIDGSKHEALLLIKRQKANHVLVDSLALPGLFTAIGDRLPLYSEHVDRRALPLSLFVGDYRFFPKVIIRRL